MKLKLTVLKNTFSICKLKPEEKIPQWSTKGNFWNICKTDDELSIVCESKFIPENTVQESDYCCFKVLGPLDFSLTGITSKLSEPLAKANIPMFAIATYDTDYILVKNEKLEEAKKIYSKFCELV